MSKPWLVLNHWVLFSISRIPYPDLRNGNLAQSRKLVAWALRTIFTAQLLFGFIWIFRYLMAWWSVAIMPNAKLDGSISGKIFQSKIKWIIIWISVVSVSSINQKVNGFVRVVNRRASNSPIEDENERILIMITKKILDLEIPAYCSNHFCIRFTFYKFL